MDEYAKIIILGTEQAPTKMFQKLHFLSEQKDTKKRSIFFQIHSLYSIYIYNYKPFTISAE